MKRRSQTLAKGLIKSAESKLLEWDGLDTPLEVAYEVQGEDEDGPNFVPTSDASYRGYGLWSHRMDWLNMASFIASTQTRQSSEHRQNTGATHVVFSDASHPHSIEAAVDFIALMENARLSFGLMLVFETELHEDSERLFCLFYYDAVMRLVSATDRLRTMFLAGLFDLDERDVDQHASKHRRFSEYFELDGLRLRASGTSLRRKPNGRQMFLDVARQMWAYVGSDKSPIIATRRRRNDLTHVMGTIPGKRIVEQGNKKKSIPYFLTAYGAAVGDSLPKRSVREMISKNRDSYRHILRFGSLVFELEHFVASAR